jgi:hypothetical protein
MNECKLIAVNRLLGLAGLLLGAIIPLSWGVAVAFADSSTIVLPRSAEPAKAGINIDRRIEISASNAITYTLYFPSIGRALSCASIPGESYGTVAIIPPVPTNPPAENHPDLNLSLRGYVPTTGTLGLVTIPSSEDPDVYAPQLYNLFGDQRTPAFSNVYQVYSWDWPNNRRGALLSDPPVTLVGIVTLANEIIHVPGTEHDIGQVAAGYSAMVLYATQTQLTLKYTREDNVVSGYTIHLENVCVEPSLLYLYQRMNAAGRTLLPALNAGQGVGRAMTTSIGVAIRDTGAFMDPRSRTDWWQGR